jgi:hypothetical protein
MFIIIKIEFWYVLCCEFIFFEFRHFNNFLHIASLRRLHMLCTETMR